MLDCLFVDRVWVLFETKTYCYGWFNTSYTCNEKWYSANKLHTWLKADEHMCLLINTSVHIHKYVQLYASYLCLCTC